MHSEICHMSRFHLRILIVAVLLSLSIQGFGSVRVNASTPIETLYTGLNFPVSFTFAPDGRIFYNEKNTGYIQVIQNGVILSTPFATVPLPPGSGPLSVNSTEEGLLGIALDPNFETNGYVYAYWTHLNATYKQVIITRWTVIWKHWTDSRQHFQFHRP